MTANPGTLAVGEGQSARVEERLDPTEVRDIGRRVERDAPRRRGKIVQGRGAPLNASSLARTLRARRSAGGARGGT
jgi:hypothetical protein